MSLASSFFSSSLELGAGTDHSKACGLLDIVTALNRPDSPFETFGCDRGLEDWTNPQFPDCITRYGSYLDIAFLNRKMCSPENYKEIIRKFREYAAEKQIKGFYSMMHVFFSRRPTVSPQGSW